MSPFPVPALLARAVAEEGDPERTEWLGRLPGIVEGLAGRWSLAVGAPFQPGGQVSWVAPARDAAGRELVLKVGWTHDEGRDEAAGLRTWCGRGAVQVFEVGVEGPTTALLLERCLPGGTLKGAHAEPDQDEVVAGLLRRLWREPPSGHDFRPLAQMCDRWADGFEADLDAEPGALDPGLARAGVELFRGLSREDVPQRLLATDLHADNVLAAQREPWLVIDPKPYVGDPAYDVLQHMLNCPERLQTAPRELARRMAGLAGLDAERVQTWLFARAVQECVDMPWLREVVPRLAPR
ncbi:MAG TPA: aminoglycoside phosphotransferase family protein [Pseudonocardia sp.]|nr:aminoglycoside phosphotransferase family protein [Pseudonocardia sp.]